MILTSLLCIARYTISETRKLRHGLMLFNFLSVST
uniref:Uncharacterized protein n=1 Tax=Rhizophora mucronata TaxID=61149 RepID=A0A2P2PEQ9_RHIMU